MAFRGVGTPMDEMRGLERLRARDPASASAVVANGQLLITWARDGRLRELQCALASMPEERVLVFYAVRMFRGAVATRRLDVLRFMLANGFDLRQAIMRDILHEVIDGLSGNEDADAVQPLIRFLLEAGVDVNWQRNGDLCTALHLACRKNLYAVAYLLLIYGADANAIAANDEMPMRSAERLTSVDAAPTTDDLAANERLRTLLQENGARRTWRRGPSGTSSSGSNACAVHHQRQLLPPSIVHCCAGTSLNLAFTSSVRTPEPVEPEGDVEPCPPAAFPLKPPAVPTNSGVTVTFAPSGAVPVIDGGGGKDDKQRGERRVLGAEGSALGTRGNGDADVNAHSALWGSGGGGPHSRAHVHAGIQLDTTPPAFVGSA